MLSPAKLKAEGKSSETQIVLGWTINTRKLTVALPKDKFIAWRGDIQKLGFQAWKT